MELREAENLATPDIELATARPRLVAGLAGADEQIVEAQRLRYLIFSEEFGATLSGADGVDSDYFDQYCHHMMVRDEANGGKLVGYTRILTSEQAHAVGGFYSSSEFQMEALLSLPGRILELGRTCIHPDYRDGPALGTLWNAVAQMLTKGGYDYLIGCASISLSDPAYSISDLMSLLRSRYMADKSLRVTPKLPLPLRRKRASEQCAMPSLLKTYLAMGARACGECCWDPDFDVADVLLLLDVDQLSSRYAKRFLRCAARKSVA